MKRLTEWDEYGNADIIALDDMMPCLYAELSFSESNALTDAISRLAAYEDTGLSPEEVDKLCSMKERGKMADLLRLEEYKELGTIEELKRAKENEKKRGFWRYAGRNYSTPISKCSCCGALYDFTPPCCPSCGALMEDDDEWTNPSKKRS